jgi:hypothetical protein
MAPAPHKLPRECAVLIGLTESAPAFDELGFFACRRARGLTFELSGPQRLAARSEQ